MEDQLHSQARPRKRSLGQRQAKFRLERHNLAVCYSLYVHLVQNF